MNDEWMPVFFHLLLLLSCRRCLVPFVSVVTCQVHCSLSSFLVGFHVHEKALLIPAVLSALSAFNSTAEARVHLRLSFLSAFAVLPLLPGPELMVLKASLVSRAWREIRVALQQNRHARLRIAEDVCVLRLRIPPHVYVSAVFNGRLWPLSRFAMFPLLQYAAHQC